MKPAEKQIPESPSMSEDLVLRQEEMALLH